jgi:hypothetical protein
MACAPEMVGRDCGDQNIQDQRCRFDHGRRETKQRKRRDVTRSASLANSRIQRRKRKDDCAKKKKVAAQRAVKLRRFWRSCDGTDPYFDRNSLFSGISAKQFDDTVDPERFEQQTLR